MKTLIIGASMNPERYAFKAANRLLEKGHEIVMIGSRKGEIKGNEILTDNPELTDIDTVTMYVGVKHQAEFYAYLLKLKPRRVIFNPGTENADFESVLQQNHIETIEACTLVLLSIGNY